MSKQRAVVLLSGGLDSATAAAVARDLGYALHALTFDYGQRHSVEVQASKRIADALGVEQHIVLPIDLRVFGGSALTSDTRVPKGRSSEAIGDGIPVTYVPARNTIFLSYALAWAEVLLANDIFLGVNCVDYSGYPDCRPEYVAAFQAMGRLATRVGVEGAGRLTIHAPLITLSKCEIIQKGLELGVDYSMTSSCYDPAPEGVSCGRCDACLLRRAGFADAGIEDPIEYQDLEAS